MKTIAVAGTGHRPPRLGLDYSPAANEKLTLFAKDTLLRIFNEEEAYEVISGMAQGWDQALAHAAIMLAIPLVAAVPFESHPDKWPTEARKRYDAILGRAKHVEIVCPGPYAGWKFIERDKWMVNRLSQHINGGGAGVLAALFDGAKKGGTWQTMKYAGQQKVPVTNVWSAWHNLPDGVSLNGQSGEDPGHESNHRGASRLCKTPR